MSLFVSGYADIATSFAFAKGAPTGAAPIDSVVGPKASYCAFDTSSRTGVAVNETAAGTVTAFRMGDDGRSLVAINSCSAGGDDPCHASIHPCGTWVAVSNYSSGSLAILSLDQTRGVSPHAVFAPGGNVHQAVWASCGTALLVPCLGSDHVAQYRFDARSGSLTPNELGATVALPKGAGPRHIALHPSERYAYCINELDATMTRFAFDPITGALSDARHVSTLPADAPREGVSTAHVLVSPDGAFVYGSNRGHDSIVVYSVAPSDGALTPIEWIRSSGAVRVAKPRDFALSPDAAHIVVANQATDSFSIFARGKADGKLTPVSEHDLAPKGRGPCFVDFWW